MVEATLSKEQRDTALNDEPTIAPPIDADIKHSDAASRLEHLRVSDDELVGKLKYEQLSLYEKKSVLINRELDFMNKASFWGMGRYQWCIFFLCGFGYFLDLVWAQIGGLIGGQIQQELGIADNRIGDLSTCFSAGLTVGAFFWGLAVDIIGRRWAFNLTCLIASVFGLIFAAPSNYGALCFINFCIGLGVGGNIPIDALITLEFLPTNRRFLLCALSTFQPLGVTIASLISWGLVPRYACDTALPACGGGVEPCCRRSDNMGWRYAVIVCGCMTLGIFILRFVVFTFYESPKFLLAKGRDDEAIDVLYKIAKFNKQPQPQLTIDDFRLLDKEVAERESITSDEPILEGTRPLTTGQLMRQRLKQFAGQFKHLKGLLATKRMIWLSLTLWVAYMALFFSFSIAGGYLPLILRAKGIDTSAGLDETYRNYVIVYLPGVTATILGAFLMEIKWLGRKYAMAFAAALMGTSLFLFATVSSFTAYTGLNLFEYWAQSLYAALLYAATPEYFPAPYRGSGSGIASTLGRLASTVAPVASGTIFNPRSNSVLYMAGGAALVSMLAILCLPFDTRGRHTF
ncbi:hypothetical protein JCM3775_007166 [Rhodotorula graminis]|uniref:Major facilitator superfamily (MFS) profile domain-containing protein n=1 Tax=Rhodotorula graminis (strain WP1) TaxID=578459 RepID=A0A0P9GIT5_RHOGW|nr:uncharacterized protein RHOBADRAFT_39044 [Rhodotorula graminis WP1]KPV72910.1 hypothetical protein RHOBADRAFT_39044 [Rhodotorula graminis WP1]